MLSVSTKINIMPDNNLNHFDEAATLHRLMPNLADQQRVENSVLHAENRGDQQVRANSERRIGVHLARLTNLLQHEGVEARVWDSAMEELVIKPENISEGYWEQQKRIARDNGLGDMYLGRHEKDELTRQLQEAQRTGLESWRGYLEATGEQYPLWFKFYAWDGMSRLGTFDKQRGQYSKRSSGTVAPYPQLNPAALGKVYEAVKGHGESDENIAKLVKSGNFNKLYSYMLLNQKAVIPTPENPEDVHGQWREYTNDDTQAITEAAEGTPWCIAGRSMAESYTHGGGKFLLFHLQDPETGTISPTAAASVRLDERGEVVEISGLKGGSSQYVEDALIPTVQEKVKQLPGGERYLQAFEDKQMLIRMDRKYQKGEPFSREELIFLYEVERPIRYIDTYTKDSRVEEFKMNRRKHIQHLAETEGVDENDAVLMLMSVNELETKLGRLLGQGYNPNTIANKLRPEARFTYLDQLMEAGAQIDLKDLYNQFRADDQLRVFGKLQEKGADLDPDELARKFTSVGQLRNYQRLTKIGASITPEGVANALSDKERLENLWDLSEIGAKVDVDRLLKDLKPKLDTNRLALYLREGAKLDTIKELLNIDLSYKSQNLSDIARQLVAAGLSGDEVMSSLAGAKKKNRYGQDGNFNSGDDSRDRILELLRSGIEPNAILRSKVFNESHVEHELTKLLEAGADTSELMNGLGAYYTGKHIDDLIEAGAEVGDIVAHLQVEPKYVLEHFEQLNANGANLAINDVVAAMHPNDVLYEIAEATKLGADIEINDLLDRPEVSSVWVHKIDEMLALGAEPQKIADKISPKEVGYDSKQGRWDGYSDSHREFFRKNYPEVYKLAYERVRREVALKAA